MRFSEKIKKMFIWITKVVIAGTCAVIVLSIFCIVYSYDGMFLSHKRKEILTCYDVNEPRRHYAN